MSGRGRLVLVIALVVAGAGIRAIEGLLVPLAYALLTLAALDPIRRWLKARTGNWVAVLLCFLLAAGMVAALVTGLVFAFMPVVEDWSRYQPVLSEWKERASEAADAVGWSLGDGGGMGKQRVLEGVEAFASGLVLTIGFFLLAAAEVLPFDRALARATSDDVATRLRTAAARMAHDVRVYLVVRTVVGALTGALVVVGATAIGLDLPWLWGCLNFLLNYVPTLGSFLAVIPPVIFAQATGGSTDALLALAVVGGVQLVMGTVIDPLMQGKQLALSPLAVLVSVVLWGWLWGIAGAFIAIPMTMVIVRVCEQFDGSRAVYELLVREDEG